MGTDDGLVHAAIGIINRTDTANASDKLNPFLLMSPLGGEL